MKDLVIFSNTALIILITTVIFLHLSKIILQSMLSFNKIKNVFLQKYLILITAILNIVLHIVIFVLFIYYGATTEELLFFTVASSLVAMVSTNIKGDSNNDI